MRSGKVPELTKAWKKLQNLPEKKNVQKLTPIEYVGNYIVQYF